MKEIKVTVKIELGDTAASERSIEMSWPNDGEGIMDRVVRMNSAVQQAAELASECKHDLARMLCDARAQGVTA